MTQAALYSVKVMTASKCSSILWIHAVFSDLCFRLTDAHLLFISMLTHRKTSQQSPYFL